MIILLDIEIYSNNMIKEFAYLNILNPLNLKHFIIKPYKNITNNKQERWIYENIHQIPYHIGDYSIEDVIHDIPSNAIILVQGVEKIDVLSKFLPTHRFINIMAPSHKKLDNPYKHITCPHTHTTKYCVTNKIYKLYNWLSI